MYQRFVCIYSISFIPRRRCVYTSFTQRVLLPWKNFVISRVLLTTSPSLLDGSWMLNCGNMTSQIVLLLWEKCATAIPTRLLIDLGKSSSQLSGWVVSGHCTSMAGQGKTCSHVGAVLSWMETQMFVSDIRCPAPQRKARGLNQLLWTCC